ncbi:MAG: [Kiritimatiellae bacterium]|nr:[FeFe] hydrogenase H-cluster radical SAM maturase HydE [Kiritimatiellia bacterium]
MTREAILSYLTAPTADALFAEARRVRHATKGNGVFLRGLIELSSICDRNCLYCGMRHENPNVRRYAMQDDEIVACAALAAELNFGTVVLQAGECERLWTQARISQLIRRIKAETGQKITLSLGERSEADTAAWKAAGADRYLLRFETTDRSLFNRIHPGSPQTEEHPRIAQLKRMKAQGYEIGSGVMLGIPGQTLDSVVEDLLTFAELKLDMVGLGPYLKHPETPLGQSDQTSEVPVSADFTCRCYALTRLLLPNANIPSTTALSTLDPLNGRTLGLTSGANVFMPNLTPAFYREGYQIYPGKICVVAPQADSLDALKATFNELGLCQQQG